MELFAFALTTAGELAIGLAVLLVHRRVLSEHRIDRKVIQSLRVEQILGIIGMALILVGFVFRAVFII